MKITKYAHSCLLIETDERVGLFDPGNYSWDLFNIDNLNRLDYILITHEHADHMYLPFVKALTEKFPDAHITTTESAANILREAGIVNVASENNQHVTLFSADHESMEPLSSVPLTNKGIHYLDVFTSPGDSHHFSETKKILALPVTAPWGTIVRAAEIIEELKPEYVIPIHDWLWREDVCQRFYEIMSNFCIKQGVKFLQPINGQSIDIQ